MQLIKSTYVETKQFSSEANENKFLNDYGFAKLTTLKKYNNFMFVCKKSKVGSNSSVYLHYQPVIG